MKIYLLTAQRTLMPPQCHPIGLGKYNISVDGLSIKSALVVTQYTCGVSHLSELRSRILSKEKKYNGHCEDV